MSIAQGTSDKIQRAFLLAIGEEKGTMPGVKQKLREQLSSEELSDLAFVVVKALADCEELRVSSVRHGKD